MTRSCPRPEGQAWPSGSVATVVAHPDDECLWLSSVLKASSRVVFAFGEPFGRPEIAAARRRAVAELGLPGLIDLAIPESGTRLAVDLSRPRLTATGIAIADDAAAFRYEANFERLVAALRPILAGYTLVFTHNPWGEYGHPEHIQVYRAVLSLQSELGYSIGFSNYVDRKSWPLARQLGPMRSWTERHALTTDRALAMRLMAVYRRHGVWTWTNWHRWPAQETVYLRPAAAPSEDWHSLTGQELLDLAGLRWWPPPWRRRARMLC
jgi:LmbE family N-acetylglucosaminyl deacetylase